MEFDAFNIPWMVEGDYNNWQYPHACGVAQNVATPQNAPQCYVTAIGGRFATYVPAFTRPTATSTCVSAFGSSIRASISASATSGVRATTAIRT